MVLNTTLFIACSCTSIPANVVIVKLIYLCIMVLLIFLTEQVETLSRDDLASRLTLNVDAASVGALSVSDSSITIMDVSD